MSEIRQILLIGYGAIARQVQFFSNRSGLFRIGAVLVRAERTAAVAAELGNIPVVSTPAALGFLPAMAVECAGHDAVRMFGCDVLRQGTDLIVSSIGALADDGLRSDLEDAARTGGAHLVLPSGAVAGIDALRAARIGGLERVTYVSRKPPIAWLGTKAEEHLDLNALGKPTEFYRGTARTAARDYPKNANVAATVALAGLGFDATEVRLIADPFVDGNEHEIHAFGSFGELRVNLKGLPLPDNPKTSSLAAFSVTEAVVRGLGRVRY